MLKRTFSVLMLTLLLTGTLTLAFNIQQTKTKPITIVVPDDYSTIQSSNVARPASDEGLIELSPYPVVYVYPNFTEVGVGETFTIAVIGFNFTPTIIPNPKPPPSTNVPLGNLYGFDIQFTWDPTVLQYVNSTVTIPVDNYPDPIPPSPYNGSLYQPFIIITHRIDPAGNIPGASSPETRAWFSYASLDPAPPRNGNLKLSQSNYVQFFVEMEQTFLIDIMGKEFLPKYLGIIDEEIRSLKEALK